MGKTENGSRDWKNLKEGDLLNLFKTPAFISEPPKMSASEMAALCERKVIVEPFILKD